jgi:hypothetical protein
LVSATSCFLAPGRKPQLQAGRRAFLRGLVGLVCLRLLASEQLPLVPIGPPQAVRTTNDLIGVHTRLTDEVEEWKIKRTLQLVREMGARWVVEFFPWAYLEPRRARFSWEHSDMVIAHAAAQGLSLIARLGWAPEWARPAQSAPSLLPDESFASFAQFCARFVERYGTTVRHIVVWNEPNLAAEWGFQAPSALRYARLLENTYTAVKAVSPTTCVLGGALAPVPQQLSSPDAACDLKFLRELAAAGGLEHMDAFAIHAYGWREPAADAPAEDKVNFRRAELLRTLLEDYGYQEKPCFITEAGWNDHPRWAKAVSPSERIRQTLRAYALAKAHWPWCQAVAMWAFRFPWRQNSYLDYYAFVTPDFAPRAIYRAVQQYALTGELEAEGLSALLPADIATAHSAA